MMENTSKRLGLKGMAALALATVAVATIGLGAAPSQALADTSNGWVKQSDGWHYLVNGQQVTNGLFQVAGKTYYADANGLMATGWKKIDGDWYYFNANGSARTGWVKYNNYWYYIQDGVEVINDAAIVAGSDGTMNCYCFDSKGHMITGWGKCGDYTVCTDSSGKGITGWVTDSAGKKYIAECGQVVTDETLITLYEDNKQVYYLTSEDGSLYTKAGWHQYSSKWYYVNADSSCKTGWLTLKSGTYFLDDGEMDSWVCAISRTSYAFDENGKLLTSGWHTYSNGATTYAYSNGKTPIDYAKLPVKDATDGSTAYYHFVDGYVYGSSLSGAGWEQQADGTWKFATATSTYLANCTATINGKAYLFDEDGIMVTGNGWKKFNDSWYYLKSGVAQTGWQKINGSWYFLAPTSDGRMMSDNWLWAADKNCYYYLAESGKMVTGWFYVDSDEEWIYMNADGSDYFGWIKRDGVWYALWSSEAEDEGTTFIPDTKFALTEYVLKEDGSLVKGWAKIDSDWYYGNKSNGTSYTGWVTSGSTQYYVRYGIMKQSADCLQIPNATDKVTYGYAFDSNGKLITGTFTNDSGNTAYADANGVLLSGFKKIGGSWYYLDECGVISTNFTVGGLTFGSDGKLVVES